MQEAVDGGDGRPPGTACVYSVGVTPFNMSKENRTIPYQTECPKNAWVKTVSGGLDLAREEFPATPGMQTKPDARTVHKSNRKYAQCDIFGGHGIYYHLWPIGYSMALFGILPVSFNPVRISFNPVRSTLAYCVLVTAAVLWSARCMLLDRSAVLLDPQASLQARFNSVLCCIHASGLLMVPLLWLEASNTHNNEHICASLMQTLPPGALGKCRFSVCVSWMAAIFSAVFSPLLTLLYLRVIATEGGAYTHVLIHNHVMLLLFLICLLFSTQPHCVKNVANTLRACVVKELSLQYPSPRQLLTYRRAWLQLRDLTRGLVVMPATALFVLLFSMLMCTCGAYLCLAFLLEYEVGMACLMLVLGTHFYGLLILVCDSAHRTVIAVSEMFLRPLETYCGPSGIGEAALDEINTFREIVASNVITVSAGGFWDINRGTMSSIAAAVVSYIVILIQFRQSEHSADSVRNGTLRTSNISN